MSSLVAFILIFDYWDLVHPRNWLSVVLFCICEDITEGCLHRNGGQTGRFSRSLCYQCEVVSSVIGKQSGHAQCAVFQVVASFGINVTIHEFRIVQGNKRIGGSSECYSPTFTVTEVSTSFWWRLNGCRQSLLQSVMENVATLSHSPSFWPIWWCNFSQLKILQLGCPVNLRRFMRIFSCCAFDMANFDNWKIQEWRDFVDFQAVKSERDLPWSFWRHWRLPVGSACILDAELISVLGGGGAVTVLRTTV